MKKIMFNEPVRELLLLHLQTLSRYSDMEIVCLSACLTCLSVCLTCLSVFFSSPEGAAESHLWTPSSPEHFPYSTDRQVERQTGKKRQT